MSTRSTVRAASSTLGSLTPHCVIIVRSGGKGAGGTSFGWTRRARACLSPIQGWSCGVPVRQKLPKRLRIPDAGLNGAILENGPLVITAVILDQLRVSVSGRFLRLVTTGRNPLSLRRLRLPLLPLG